MTVQQPKIVHLKNVLDNEKTMAKRLTILTYEDIDSVGIKMTKFTAHVRRMMFCAMLVTFRGDVE